MKHVPEPGRESAARPGPAPRTPADEQLVRAAAQGDRTAFERLVRRHHRALVSHIRRLIGSHDGALDLAQEVFLKVYLSLASFDPTYRFTTWLYRIASNCAIDHLRKKHPPTCALSTESRDGAAEGEPRSIAGTQPTPDQVVELRQLEQRLEIAVRDLPPDYRQLILLRHRQHCRYDEIARITGLPIGTVKNRIFRAREILRQLLADLLPSEE